MAKPTIDISSNRAKLDEAFKNGTVSPREYRRIQTGMGNIANGQNQGFDYKIDPGSRTFSAEKNGEQAKGKIGGVTRLNPLAGRKTSKAIHWINANGQKQSDTSAPAKTEAQVPKTEESKTGGFRLDPSKPQHSKYSANVFQNPTFSKPSSVLARFSYAPTAQTSEKQVASGGEKKQPTPAASAGNKGGATDDGYRPSPLVPEGFKNPLDGTDPAYPQNKEMTRESYNKKIADYTERIALGRRNPTNRIYEDNRTNAAFYQSEVERLKAEYFRKFGRQEAGSMSLEKGYRAPGQRPIFWGGGMFKQSGRDPQIDLDGVINTGMGVYALASGLTNKSPRVPTFQKAQFRIRPASGDYDTLQRNLNTADSNYQSMARKLRDNVGSDRTTYIRGLLGAGQFRNQSNQEAYAMDSQIRMQDRQREDAMKMAEDQYNIQGKNQELQQKFSWDAQRWMNRSQGSQQMLNSSLNFGVQKRANMANNEVATKQANKTLTFMEANLRQQLISEFIRNNGGRRPTDEELQGMVGQLVPNNSRPSIFQ